MIADLDAVSQLTTWTGSATAVEPRPRKAIAMLDFSAYLAAQHVTQDNIRQAQTSSRLQADPATGSMNSRLVAARQWTSTMLRQLADFIAIRPDVSARSQPLAHHA
jgi:hypothetical protein